MHEYAGPLQRVVLSRTLWVMVALPLLGVAWHVVLWRRRAAHAGGGGPTEAQLSGARTVGVGTAVVTAAAVIGHVISLLRLDAASRAMLDPLARGVALGGLEAPLDLLAGRDRRGRVHAGVRRRAGGGGGAGDAPGGPARVAPVDVAAPCARGGHALVSRRRVRRARARLVALGGGGRVARRVVEPAGGGGRGVARGAGRRVAGAGRGAPLLGARRRLGRRRIRGRRARRRSPRCTSSRAAARRRSR